MGGGSLFSRSPLTPSFIFLLAGLLAPDRVRPPIAVTAAAAFVLLAVGLASLLATRVSAEPGAFLLPAAAALIPVAFLPLGLLLREAPDLARPADEICRRVQRESEVSAAAAELEGIVHSEPRPRPAPEEGCSLELEVQRVEADRASRPASGRVRITLPAPPPGVFDACLLVPGTRIRLASTVFPPRSFGNPGALDYARYLQARGIGFLGRAPSARLITVLDPPSAPARALSRLRRGILHSLDRAFASSASRDASSISKALLLGVRDGVPRGTEILMQRAGTSHLLAVSGFNVAVLAAAVLLALRALSLRGSARALVLAATLAIYLLLTGGEPSVERAVFAAILLLAGLEAGRRTDPLALTATVGALLVGVAPGAANDVSFQLTFLATAALARWAGPLSLGVPGPRWLASAIAVDVVALAITSPATAWLFNRATPGAIAANLAASPLMAVAFLASGAIPAAEWLRRGLSILGVLFAPGLSPPSLLARAAGSAIDAALACGRLVCAIPGMSYLCVTPARWVIVSALLATTLAGARHAPRPARRIAASAAASLAIVCLLPGERPALRGLTVREATAPPGALRLTVFDVGQGSSALVELPGGARLLVDGGGFAASSFDVGERVIARSLLTLGVRNLSAIAITHEDFDHVGGIPSILELFPGEEIWVPSAGRVNRGVARIAELGVEKGRAVRLMLRGMRFDFGGARIEVLHPPRSPGPVRDNDLSLVLRVAFAGRSLLLPGDIESGGEREIAGVPARSDVLLVPHHGSRTSSSAGLLDAVRPSIGIISCGYLNRFKHPHTEVLARLANAGVRVARTDLDGAQRVTIARSGAGIADLVFERWAGDAWVAWPDDPPGSGGRSDRARDE